MNKAFTVIFLFISIFIMLSCKKDNNNPITPGLDGLSGNKLSGKINNWPGVAKKSIKCYFGSGIINQDGGFSIQLNTPSDSILTSVTNILSGYQCASSPTISDQSGRIGPKIEEFEVVSSDSQWVNYGTVYCVSDKDSLGEAFNGFLAYVDKNLSITGNFNCARDNYPYPPSIKQFQWNMRFVKGWNLYYVKEYEVSGTSYNIATSTKPTGSKWIYNGQLGSLNNPPNTPSNPNPSDGATSVPRTLTLSWIGSDPDPADTLKYDLFFSSDNPPNAQLTSNWTTNSFYVSGLDTNRTYYWRVTARDSRGVTTIGSIWRFTTVAGSSGLIAYYTFNSNANDESGNGNHGSVNGSTLTTDRFGNTDRAYFFNGTSNQIMVLNTIFDVGWQEYTISGWFSSTDSNKTNQCMFNTIPHTGIGIDYNYYTARSYVSYGLNSNPAVSTWDITGPRHGSFRNIQSDQWYHFVFIKSNNKYSMYINGILDDTLSASKVPISYKCGFRIGSIGVSSGEYFKGKLDDYRIYNRALTDVEIQALYHEGGW